MERNQIYIVLSCIGIVILAWAVAPLLGSRLQPGVPLSSSGLGFDPVQALARTTEFVTRNPRRVMGSLESRQSSGYIQQYLKGLGYDVNYLHFESVIAGRRQVGRNIFALKPGKDSRIVALIAHYDTAPTTLQGAMDNGSGVGVLLEIARVFSTTPTNHSLLFVASDGEEWGMLGAGDFARNYPERERIAAVLSLDYVAAGTLAGLELETAGQFRGYTSPWLRDIARRAVRAGNMTVFEPSGIQEHLDRTLLVSGCDQGPFLAEGIDAINLGSRSEDGSLERSAYHSAYDTVDNLRVESFASYGRTAERIVRTLDELPSPPDQPGSYLRFSEHTFLAGGLVRALHVVTFLPLLAAAVILALNYGRHAGPRNVVRELAAFALTLIPFLVCYYAISVAAIFRLLPRYALYPATPKDPVLDHPSWGALFLILGAGTAAGVCLYFAWRFWRRSFPRPEFNVSKLILLSLMMVGVVLALAYNSYWAVSFLALPAWLWAITGPGDLTGARAANRVWIAAAGIVYYLVSVAYASRLGLGWKLVWYEMIALNTGMFSLAGFMLGAACAALGIRFLVIQSHTRSS
jgi:hypothetical protein